MTVDDLGTAVPLPAPPQRIVSLVPSLTEAVAATVPSRLVGATDWCTHPAGLAVTRVRGTKNPSIAAIVALQPDLVIANQEENRRVDVERLRAAGVPVWVTVIESVAEALASMRRLFVSGLQVAVPAWLQVAEREWALPAVVSSAAVSRTAVVPIWRDPWMVVGSRTFTGDLLRCLGIDNVFNSHSERYPHVTVTQIMAAEPSLVILPDEPYRFTADDGPEEFPGAEVALVEGRLLTWYGPSLATARRELGMQLFHRG